MELACADSFSSPNILSCAKDILLLTLFGVESCRGNQIISVPSGRGGKSARGRNGPVDELKFLNHGKVLSSVGTCPAKGSCSESLTQIDPIQLRCSCFLEDPI